MLTLIATLIVWAFIQAFCDSNPTLLFVIVILYTIFSIIGEFVY